MALEMVHPKSPWVEKYVSMLKYAKMVIHFVAGFGGTPCLRPSGNEAAKGRQTPGLVGHLLCCHSGEPHRHHQSEEHHPP